MKYITPGGALLFTVAFFGLIILVVFYETNRQRFCDNFPEKACVEGHVHMRFTTYEYFQHTGKVNYRLTSHKCVSVTKVKE